MSIISDALKKVQKTMQEKRTFSEEEAQALFRMQELETGKAISGINRLAWTLPFDRGEMAMVWTAGAISVFVLVALFTWPKMHFIQPGPIKMNSAKVYTGFKLSGITKLSDAQWYAIINGIIVKTGDKINAAVVKSITANKVVLSSRKGEISLSI